nr:hypothetical protein [Deltaproteobacteria bacterium]
MTAAALDDEGFAPLGPFELEGSSEPGDGSLLEVLRLLGVSERATSEEAREEAAARLAEAWSATGSVGLERDALARESAPTPSAIERLLALYIETGRWTDAARAAEALAAHDDTPERRAVAWSRWAAAGSPEDARRFAREGDPSRVAAAYLARSAECEEVLASAAEKAQRDGETEAWRSLSLDAWIHAQGARGADRLIDALRACGRSGAAMYVALEDAARAYLAGGDASLHRATELATGEADALAVWTLRALLPGPDAASARETLRDLLADRGRSAELAVRLRIDAWSAPESSRAAAWKGVAAMELPHDPLLATRALVEGLRAQPDDAEALALLRALAAEPTVEGATRDAVWGLVRTPELSPARRRELLLWLGALEEAAGDLAAAESAYASIEGAVPEAFEGLGRVYEGAARQVAQAETEFGSLAAAAAESREGRVDEAVARCASTPGAMAAAGSALETLAGLSLHHAGAAALWVRAARRSADRATLAAVLRRLATRCELAPTRREALLECLTLPELSAGGGSDAVELLRLFLEDLPGDTTAAAALAALAEQRADAELTRDAIRAVAMASQEPTERDILLRFVGVRSGAFEALGAATEEPVPSAGRGDRLRRLHHLVGDSVTLLSLRTRALMASPGTPGEGLAVARRFVEAAPWSPEAVFAFAGLTRLGDDGAEVVAAIRAALRSCARLPELASLVRGAVARLAALGDETAVHHVLDAATDAGLLADPALAELALSRPHGDVLVRRLEIAIAASDSPDPAWIARLVGLREAAGDALGALGARVRGPHAGRAKEEELDALADGATDDAAQGRWVRCAVANGLPQVSLRWLSRWAAARGSEPGAGLRLRCAARVAWDLQGDGEGALEFLRDALRAEADTSDVLQDADLIGRRSGQLDGLLAIYDDASGVAAGVHGRQALHYRRALALEHGGRAAEALEAQLALFRELRTIGAPLHAIERMAGASGRWEPLLEAFEILAAEAPSSEAKLQFLLRCAEIARSRLKSAERALGFEVQAWQVSRSRALWDRVIERSHALRATHPAAATEAIHALVDGELTSAQQAWDDSVRGVHALQALDCALTEAHDHDRAVAAIELYLRQHEAPRIARSTVLEMIGRASVPPELQRALRASSALSSTPPPPPTPTPNPNPTRPPSRGATLELVLDDDLSADGLERAMAPTPAPVAPSRPPKEGHEWISFVAEPKPVTLAPTKSGGVEAPPIVVPQTLQPRLEAFGREDGEADSFLITSIQPQAARRPSPKPEAPAAQEPQAPAAQEPAASVTGADPEGVLRERMARHDDEAAVILAERLAADPERAHEAVVIQRARFDADPTRLDALDALIKLATQADQRGETLGLTQVRSVLRGDALELHPLHPVELEDPPDGVARVLLPTRLGPFAELGALLWESVGVTWRRELQRSALRDEGYRLAPTSAVLRPFQAALRLLQLPRTTALLMRDGPIAAPTLSVATTPASLVMSLEQATDTPAGHFALGFHLEGARVGHLPLTALSPEVADRMVRALTFAFGAPMTERVEPSVAAAAAQLMDATPTRLHRQLRAYVEELGPSFTPARWRAVIDQARARAGLLVSGDFFEASRWLLASAPMEVPRSLSWALVEWEPLRDLLRFAVSEEYLMLRWPNSDGRRRRVSSRPAPTESR